MRATTVLQAGGLRLDLMTRRVTGGEGGEAELSDREVRAAGHADALPRTVFTRPSSDAGLSAAWIPKRPLIFHVLPAPQAG